ncbi:hypothetical protein H0H87_010607, partial [Tephrocybe sp. NHM501043]
LRDIKDPDDIDHDGLTLSGRLQTLMESIKVEIEACATLCDVYMNKSLIRKYIKCLKYEARFAKFVAQFSEFEAKIQLALTAHTAHGVNSLHHKIDAQGTRLEEMQSRIEELFISLDTPREKEIRDIIKRGGGAKSSINDNQVLQSLIDKSGEDIPSLANKVVPDKFSELRTSLLNELAEDIQGAMDQNFKLFQGKLFIQEQELNTIKEQGERILEYVSGGHEQIIDPVSSRHLDTDSYSSHCRSVSVRYGKQW